jgi:DNA-binding response OmpR family regulator
VKGDRSSRVVVLEHEAVLRELVVDILRAAGMDAQGADNAGDLPTGWRGGVIVSDTFSSPYRVADVARHIAELRERHRATVLLLTGHSQVVRDEREIGADAIVLKPFDVDEFVSVVESLASRA